MAKSCSTCLWQGDTDCPKIDRQQNGRNCRQYEYAGDKRIARRQNAQLRTLTKEFYSGKYDHMTIKEFRELMKTAELEKEK